MVSAFGDRREFHVLLLDHVSDCVVAVDAEGYIVFINRPYCRLLGGSAEDFVGRLVTEVISSETKLHLVAAGAPPVLGAPLKVRGHHLITRQVPIKLQGEVVGAVGVALFSDTQQAVALAREIANDGVHIAGESAWRARYSLEDFVGSAPNIVTVREQALDAAELDLPVLLCGETGTGKEIIAQAIHRHSNRDRAPFVAVNCATIPKDLVESELFGYEGGAFTGARNRGARGRFEIAQGGTIFLDEIGELPVTAQAALLRVLQERDVVRVGGSKPISVDVRVICATHRDLYELCRRGEFRIDLLHRIDVIRVQLPSLRERSDKPEILDHILQRTCRRIGVQVPTVSVQALADLDTYTWPGNVRELENVVTKAVLRSRHFEKPAIEVLGVPREHPVHDPDMKEERQGAQSGLLAQRDQFERDTILAALETTNGRVLAAAAHLKISRVTLYKKMRRHSLTEYLQRQGAAASSE